MTTVLLPVDLEPDVAQSVNVPFQTLADALTRLQTMHVSNFAPVELSPSFYAIRGASAGKLSLAFPSDLWCVVGGAGSTTAELYISTSGELWESVSGLITNTPPGPVLIALNAVAHDETLGVWVAVGDPEGGDAYLVSSSSPQSAWTERSTVVNASLRSVASNGAGVFVAVGDGGVLIRSVDGTTWTEETSGTGNNLRKVVWAGALSKWIAVGGTGATARLIYSANGIAWTTATTPGTAACHDVAWDGTALCATCTDGSVLTSTNGTSWALVAAPGYPAFASVAIGGDPSGVLLASAQFGLYASFDHGANFDPVGSAGAANNVYGTMDVQAIAFGNGRFVIAGGSGGVGVGLRRG
jgi:hypothetical protein